MMQIIKYILLAIFALFILAAIVGLVSGLSSAAWQSLGKLKSKTLGKFVAIIITTIVALLALAFAVAMLLLSFYLLPFPI